MMKVGDRVRSRYRTDEVGVVVRLYPDNAYNILVRLDTVPAYTDTPIGNYKEAELEMVQDEM